MWWELVLGGRRDFQEGNWGLHKVLRGSGMHGGLPLLKEQTVWLVGSLELFSHVPV